jgi:hypothetical protein
MDRTLLKETFRILILAAVINAPALALAQAPPPGNPVMQLPKAIASSPGVLGVETAMTESGKAVIFAWFENKKAVLAWYYSDTHRMLMKMSGGGGRPEGPLASVPDDGRPVLAIASVTLAPPGSGTAVGPFPAITQIAIELYAPLPGGLASGGRFAPSTVPVPGLLQGPLTPPATKP